MEDDLILGKEPEQKEPEIESEIFDYSPMDLITASYYAMDVADNFDAMGNKTLERLQRRIKVRALKLVHECLCELYELYYDKKDDEED